MGIPRLSRVLANYSVLTTLKDESIVIDGPSLVYQLWGAQVNDLSLSNLVLGQLPYSRMAQKVIDWLDNLRAGQVIVRKIYFDGFLPPRKWETRLDRLIESTLDMNVATSAFKKLALEVGKEGKPTRNPSHAYTNHWEQQRAGKYSPKYPFLVPSVIEALKNSIQWKSVVQVVPGEADAFCAQDVRLNGGTVMTSDSDLLIEDLGADGSVVLFEDIVENMSASKDKPIFAKKHSRQALETRLGVEGYGGLPRMAYEMSSKNVNLEQAVQYTKVSLEKNLPEQKLYQKFVSEHQPEEYITEDHPLLPVLSTLDPRISELVIQSLNLQVTSPNSTGTSHSPRGPEEMAMFLPVMIEDYQRKSSWSMSEPVRQLAYGIAQYSHNPRKRGFNEKLRRHGDQQRKDKIIEYRTLTTRAGGRELDITDARNINSWCQALLAILGEFNVQMEYPHSKWFAFAIYQDVEWSRNIGDTPVSVVLARQTINVIHDVVVRYSMDVVYLAAQVQACLYSLRMLKQILDVMADLNPKLVSEPRECLRDCLSTLPGIAEYPTAVEMFDLLAQFVKADGLVMVSQIMGIPEINLCEAVEPGSANGENGRQSVETRKQDNKTVSTTARADFRRGTSANLFTVLDDNAQ